MIAVVDYHKGNLKSVERGLAAAGGDVLVTDDAAAIARARAIVLPGVGAFADASATMTELGQMGVIRRRIAAGVPFLGICLGMHLMFEEGMEGAPQEDDEDSTHNAKGLAVLPGVVAKMPKQDEHGLSYKVPHVGWNTVVPPSCHPERSAEGSLPCHPEWSAEGAESKDPARRQQEACRLSPNGILRPRFAGPPCARSACSGVRQSTGLSNAPLAQDDKPSAPSAQDGNPWSCPLFAGIPSGTYFYFTHSYIAPAGPFVVGETSHSATFPSAVQYGEAAFGVQFHPEKSSDAGAALLRNFVSIVKGA